MIYLICLLFGGIVGFFTGLLGLGGGIMIVPWLIYLLKHNHFPPEVLMQFAIGTSLATMVFSTMSASFFHHKKGAVLWRLFWYIVPGTMVGSALGVTLLKYIQSDVLKLLFSLFCIVMSFLFFKKETHRKDLNGELPIREGFLTPIGAGVGTLSGLIGIGGGVILVPILVRLHIPLQKASALSASCTLPTVAVGMMSAIILGWNAAAVPMPHLGYVVWPLALIQGIASAVTASYGVHLAHRLPKVWLRRILATLLLIIAVIMLPKVPC